MSTRQIAIGVVFLAVFNSQSDSVPVLKHTIEREQSIALVLETPCVAVDYDVVLPSEHETVSIQRQRIPLLSNFDEDVQLGDGLVFSKDAKQSPQQTEQLARLKSKHFLPIAAAPASRDFVPKSLVFDPRKHPSVHHSNSPLVRKLFVSQFHDLL